MSTSYNISCEVTEDTALQEVNYETHALILMILALVAGLVSAVALAVGTGTVEVSFRIEGQSENLYTAAR